MSRQGAGEGRILESLVGIGQYISSPLYTRSRAENEHLGCHRMIVITGVCQKKSVSSCSLMPFYNGVLQSAPLVGERGMQNSDPHIDFEAIQEASRFQVFELERAKKLFNEKDIFRFDSADYQESQFHSSCVDRILGIPVHSVEQDLREEAKRIQPGGTVESWSKALHQGALTWVGLNPSQLQTPYAELLQLLEALDMNEGESFVDLGAGYGRIGMIMGKHWPKNAFTGFEMAQERVLEGNKAFKRYGLESAKLIASDIAAKSFQLPKADYFFIYDFGSLSDIKKLLAKVEVQADEGRVFSVLARGRGINSLIQETAPWLTINPKVIGNTTVYSFR